VAFEGLCDGIGVSACEGVEVKRDAVDVDTIADRRDGGRQLLARLLDDRPLCLLGLRFVRGEVWPTHGDTFCCRIRRCCSGDVGRSHRYPVEPWV